MLDGDIDGNEWQQYVDDLLQCHHQGGYQRVPATNGDCGMEGYTHDGNGYQSYSDQNSKTHEERTKKQRAKLTRDINKLVKHKNFWATLFQTTKLRRWHFVVPHFDEKQLLQHAAKKRDELKSSNLPFIADDFEIVIQTHRDYPIARTLLQDPTLASTIPVGSPPTAEQLHSLRRSKPIFVSNIDDKLKMAMSADATEEEREQATKSFLEWHLKCENYLQKLRSKFPKLWEQIDELGTVMADSLKTEEHFDRTQADQRMLNVMARFEASLAEKAKFTDGAKRVVLSWGHVARWLGECPLSFSQGVMNAS